VLRMNQLVPAAPPAIQIITPVVSSVKAVDNGRPNVMRYKLSDHAKRRLEHRGIPRDLLEAVLNDPQQVVAEQGGRKVYQSQVDRGDGQIVLLRAIVIDDVEPAVVVTVYCTKQIQKYWRQL
jgi:Domain of unknown function (DUF4258)